VTECAPGIDVSKCFQSEQVGRMLCFILNYTATGVYAQTHLGIVEHKGGRAVYRNSPGLRKGWVSEYMHMRDSVDWDGHWWWDQGLGQREAGACRTRVSLCTRVTSRRFNEYGCVLVELGLGHGLVMITNGDIIRPFCGLMYW
jgi:hypothetical protein